MVGALSICSFDGGEAIRVWPGSPYPPGATWDGRGVNFALFSEHATKVELCLFETVDVPTEVYRIVLPEHTDQAWHGYLPEVLPPRTPWHRTIIYELHVKGFTQLHPEVPERLRGTYLGLATEAAVRHLTSLGITAVGLMPVHHFLNDRYLVDRGLTNYWGDSTLAFIAPASRYTATRVRQDAVQQFKMMVSAMYAADSVADTA